MCALNILNSNWTTPIAESAFVISVTWFVAIVRGIQLTVGGRTVIRSTVVFGRWEHARLDDFRATGTKMLD
jgi:hypothetical protein